MRAITPFIISPLLLVFSACDYILKTKDTEQDSIITEKDIFLGADADDNGCVSSAGYKWSKLHNDCIRVFEQGIRLIPTDAFDENDDEVDLAMLNAYIIIDEAKEQVELFVHSEPQSIILQKTSDNVYVFENWRLSTADKFMLEQNNIIKYVAPDAIEKKIKVDLEYDSI